MPVVPYKRTPAPPEVALLTPQGEVVSADGEKLSLDTLPPEFRVWCSYDTAHQLVHDGQGEALCWNNEEIRWRHRRFEEGWKRRRSDVAVIRLPFHDDDPERTLQALVRWRDWLARYGAAPVGTTGSAAWSLLRARLVAPLWTSVGDPPPLLQTLGGRQELGPAGRGSFRGELEQWDLPAAYASELGALRYGGRWFKARDLPVQRPPDWWAREGRPVFVRAIVKVPPDGYGPLPRRPKGRVHGMQAMLLGATYPHGRIQGLWTWQEVAAALENGCTLVKLIETWVHISAEQPFLPWWEAIEAGRRMPGLAGLLAKTTGNALWGQFCMDVHNNGARSIRGKLHPESRRRSSAVVSRKLPQRGGRPPAHDLAETVSGRVRSRLFEAMAQAGDNLISAHTDGIWSRLAPLQLDEWRRKQQARRLDLLDPQVLRYWPRRGSPQTVFAGVPAKLADEAFDIAWQHAFGEAAA